MLKSSMVFFLFSLLHINNFVSAEVCNSQDTVIYSNNRGHNKEMSLYQVSYQVHNLSPQSDSSGWVKVSRFNTEIQNYVELTEFEVKYIGNKYKGSESGISVTLHPDVIRSTGTATLVVNSINKALKTCTAI